jgi:sec-independent protein translocase protein TatA
VGHFWPTGILSFDLILVVRPNDRHPGDFEMLAMFGIGSTEVIILLVVVMLLFGSTKLPQLAKAIGKSANEFKKGLNEKDDEPNQIAQP